MLRAEFANHLEIISHINIFCKIKYIFLYLQVAFPAVLIRYLSEKECKDVILLSLYKGFGQCIFNLHTADFK